MQKRRIVIDADSIIYQSCFNTADKIEEIPQDTDGIYTIAWEKVNPKAENCSLLRTDAVRIPAVDEDSAKIQYSNVYDVPIAETVVIHFEPNEDDIALDTAVDESLEEGQRAFTAKVNEIVTATTARYKDLNPVPLIVITTKSTSKHCIDHAPNYRYEIMANVEDEAVKGYKANRANLEAPDGLVDLYNWVFTQEHTICEEGCEADDVVVRLGLEGHLVAALDKDVLGSLEEAYNYGKKEWSVKTALEVKQFPFLQTIMGDTSDGLRGVFRVGAKGAEKALKNKETDIEMWTAVVTEYFKKGQTLEEAIATMLCVRMDMWNKETGIVYWTPPIRAKKELT